VQIRGEWREIPLPMTEVAPRTKAVFDVGAIRIVVHGPDARVYPEFDRRQLPSPRRSLSRALRRQIGSGLS
jgi:hypothetical protein